MRRAVGVEISGLKELRRALKSIDPRLVREANAALRDAVRPIATDARSRAPRRSGALASSVRAGASGRGAFVGTRSPYAGVQEFGGTIRFTSRAGEIHITAQPFLRPAVDDGIEDAVERVGDAIDRLAERNGFR